MSTTWAPPLQPLALDGLVRRADLCRWLGIKTLTITRRLRKQQDGDPLALPAPVKGVVGCDVWPVGTIVPWAHEAGLVSKLRRDDAIGMLADMAAGLGYKLTPATEPQNS